MASFAIFLCSMGTVFNLCNKRRLSDNICVDMCGDQDKLPTFQYSVVSKLRRSPPSQHSSGRSPTSANSSSLRPSCAPWNGTGSNPWVGSVAVGQGLLTSIKFIKNSFRTAQKVPYRVPSSSTKPIKYGSKSLIPLKADGEENSKLIIEASLHYSGDR